MRCQWAAWARLGGLTARAARVRTNPHDFWHLETPASIWKHLQAAENTCNHKKTFGFAWIQLVIYCNGQPRPGGHCIQAAGLQIYSLLKTPAITCIHNCTWKQLHLMCFPQISYFVGKSCAVIMEDGLAKYAKNLEGAKQIQPNPEQVKRQSKTHPCLVFSTNGSGRSLVYSGNVSGAVSYTPRMSASFGCCLPSFL